MTSSGESSFSGRDLALACALLGIAALLVALVFTRPPRTPCEPLLGMAGIAFAAAQAAFALGLGATRRARVSALLAIVLPACWALVGAAILAQRQVAGDLEAFGMSDGVFAAGAALGLFLMPHGMALRLERASAPGWILVAIVAFGVGIGWIALMDGRPADRTWASNEAVNRFGAAISAYQEKTSRAPVSDRPLATIARDVEEVLGAEIPLVGGWGRELQYRSDGMAWEVASRGAFGLTGPEAFGPVRGFDDDLVVSQEGPISWPEPCGADAGEAAAIRKEMARPEDSEFPLPAPPGVIDKREAPRRR